MRTAGLAVLLALGCASAGGPTPAGDRALDLTAALRALPGPVDPGEASRLAITAVGTTDALAARYRPLRPPLLGNLAFHLGLRERALCCHWAEDLLHGLGDVELTSLELHWGVAHFGSRLREHSSVIAVPRGGDLSDGLVLDAWRDSGRLYWVRVDEDSYPWRLHPSDDLRDRLACSDGGAG